MKPIVIMTVCFSLLVFVGVGQNEKSIGNTMPNRISMNVTVPKQTQGATFGEKVNAGLRTNGAFVIFPNKQAFLIAQNKVTEMNSTEVGKVNAGLHATGGALAQGASLVGGALPGGAIISAAVSSYGTGSIVWQIQDAGNELKMPSSLPDGEYELALTMDGASKEAAKVRVFFGLQVERGTYKVVSARTKHDTVKNSINNVR